MSEQRGKRMSRMISTVMLFIVTLVVGILFYRVMVGFFVPLFLAALLVVIFRPVHEWIGARLGGRPRLAALATTLAIMFVVLLPAVLVIGIAAAQGTSLVSRVNYNSLAFALERSRVQLGLDIADPEPYERLPGLVSALSETDDLNEPRQVAKAGDRLRELTSVLRELEEAQKSLTDEQAAEFAEVRLRIDELSEQLAVVNQPPSPAGIGSGESPSDVPPEPVADEESQEAIEPSAEQTSDIAGDPTAEVEEAPLDEIATKEAYRSPEERFQRTLLKLDTELTRLRDVLLGGSMRAQLKMWANPSREKVDTLFSQAREFAQARVLSVTSATGEFLAHTLIGVTILVITLYFFLVDGPGMVRTLMRLSPLDDRYEHKLLLEFDRTSRAVVLATVLSALAQGILAAIGYYFADLGSIVLLFLLTSFMALIPFLGAASIWVPCALWLGLVEERWGAAIGLAIYGAVVVSSVDNVIKVFVLHGRSQLHPLLALLSVLGGVQVFGPIGILVGPMVVVFLQTTLEILNHELTNYETQHAEVLAGAFAGGTPDAGGGELASVKSEGTEEAGEKPKESPEAKPLSKPALPKPFGKRRRNK